MSKNQSLSLTYIRGLGAICIMIYHYFHWYSMYIKEIKFKYFDFGWFTYAVPMFFVMSAMFLFRKAIKIDNPVQLIFYRIVRLIPAYWLACVLSYVIRCCGMGETISIKDLLINLTMLEDLVGIEQLDGVYWTLDYELMLLFLLSIFSLIYKCRNYNLLEKTNCFCSIWLFGGTCGQVIVKSFGINKSSLNLLLFAGPYIPTFICGIYFCYIFLEKKQLYQYEVSKFVNTYINLNKREVLGGGGYNRKLLHMMFNIVWSTMYLFIFKSFASAIISLIGILLVFFTLAGRVRTNRLIFCRFFLFLGNISYPLYLCHNQLGRFVAYWFSEKYDSYILGGVFMVGAGSLSIVLAIIIHKIEICVIEHMYRALKIFKNM